MIGVSQLLDRILGHLRQLKRPVCSLLQPGLPAASVSEAFAKARITPPGSLPDIYSWRNGTLLSSGASLNDLNFFPGYYLMSLEEAIETHSILAKQDEEPCTWKETWFPLFCSGGGDFYAIECDRSASRMGSIVFFFRDDADHPVVYESLSSMLQTVERCFAERVFYVAQEGYLTTNPVRERETARVLNPTLGYWEK
jgi:hypothetical protein